MRYPIVRWQLLVLALGWLTLMPQASGQSEVIHEERSLYRNIVVTQDGDMRCMQFDARYANMNQSCMDLEDPRRLVFD